MEKHNMEKTVKIEPKKEASPNESGSVSIQGHIKIFDPNTKEVIVNKRT